MAVTSGQPFPSRDLIIFVTTGVIVVTLVVPALLLPTVVRWARQPRDTSVDEERYFAETDATEQALAALPELAVQAEAAPPVVERVRHEYEENLRVLEADGREAGGGEADEPALRFDEEYTALRQAALAHKDVRVIDAPDATLQEPTDALVRVMQACVCGSDLHSYHDMPASAEGTPMGHEFLGGG